MYTMTKQKLNYFNPFSQNHLFRRLVVCILVQEENWHTSNSWVLLFFFSSLFCDRPVDVEGYFLSEVYVHVGCPHLARCGENTK